MGGHEAGIGLAVCITEGIPAHEMLRVVNTTPGMRIIGGNCPGLISPGKSLVGIMPGHIFAPGSVGMISRSGTLTYEIVDGLTRAGLGQSTCVGIGGDPIIGTTFVDCLREFARDPETRALVVAGEIGGSDEEDAAAFIKEHIPDKPVVAFIGGRSAPKGKRLGHAGAIISGNTGTPSPRSPPSRRPAFRSPTDRATSRACWPSGSKRSRSSAARKSFPPGGGQGTTLPAEKGCGFGARVWRAESRTTAPVYGASLQALSQQAASPFESSWSSSSTISSAGRPRRARGSAPRPSPRPPGGYPPGGLFIGRRLCVTLIPLKGCQAVPKNCRRAPRGFPRGVSFPQVFGRLAMRSSFVRTLTAVLALLVMLVQGTWVLAGTTGGIAGTVADAQTGRAIAGAQDFRSRAPRRTRRPLPTRRADTASCRSDPTRTR